MSAIAANSIAYDTFDAIEEIDVSTLSVRVRSLSTGAIVIGATNAGITQVDGSTLYRVTFTAPGTPGAYLVEWLRSGELIDGGTTRIDVAAVATDGGVIVDPPTPALAGLVSALRTLLGDPGSERWTDAALEEHLTGPGRSRREYGKSCYPVTGSNPGGTAYYLAWTLPIANVASDAEFYADMLLADPVTPSSVNHRTGAVEFPSPGHAGYLYATYTAYDLYGAAADALESWANSLAMDVNFSADGQKFDAGDRAERELARAREYRRKAWGGGVSVVRMHRSDLA